MRREGKRAFGLITFIPCLMWQLLDILGKKDNSTAVENYEVILRPRIPSGIPIKKGKVLVFFSGKQINEIILI